MDKFNLYHTALYAKGWYKKENKRNIWEDLKIIMSLDNYCGDIMDKNDITGVILSQCQKLDTRAFKDLLTFASSISPDNCWRYGYATKENVHWSSKPIVDLPKYDFKEAIVRYCLSNLMSCDIKTLCGVDKLPKPDYTKGLSRKNGVTNKKINELFV